MTRSQQIRLFHLAVLLAAVAGVGLVGLATGAPTATSEPLIFSVDIGSDKELSDPVPSGDEGFDPGDGFSSGSAAVTASPGRDGRIDDFRLRGIGIDIYPDPPDPTRATAVPLGGCSSPYPNNCYRQYLDMDGLDIVNVDLTTVGHDPSYALAEEERIWRTSTLFVDDSRACIHRLKFGAVSFDDDNHVSWLDGILAAPMQSQSPGGSTFGTTSARDEVLAITLRHASGSSGASHTVTLLQGIASEDEVHPSLAPNPDTGETEDDDVDALDVPVSDSGCDVFLFSVDHEADDALKPGAIYQFDSSTSTMTDMIHGDIHLGLSAGADIDAFELTWMKDVSASGTVGLALGLVFSVDDDDSRTPLDESGGLNPGAIYGSFLDGTNFLIAEVSTEEDIDAITVSPEDLQDWTPSNQGDR